MKGAKLVRILILGFGILVLFVLELHGQTKPTIEWVNIPAGTFSMGISKETQHQVTFKAFKMSKYEITVAQFKVFVDATGYVTDSDKGFGSEGLLKGNVILVKGKVKNVIGVNWKCDQSGNPRPSEEYNYPVIFVSYEDASAFAKWIGCRLPSEAEWEYASRSGNNTPSITEDTLTKAKPNYSILNPKMAEKLMPVGSFAPNSYGLYDMKGNVWEWCNGMWIDYKKDVQIVNGSVKIDTLISYYGHIARDFQRAENMDALVGRCGSLGFRLVSIE